MQKSGHKYKKIIILVTIIIFFSVLFIYYLSRLGIFSEDNKQSHVRNNRVVFIQPKLSIFDETRYLNEFPDTIRIHYPYLLVIVPEDKKKITTVYSLEEKKEVITLNDIALDYANGNFLYNYHGGNTFFKKKDLGIHCDQGFIKSDKEILCITAKDSDSMENKLISISPQTLTTKDLYSSRNALTALYFDKDTFYIGEYNFTNNKAFIKVNNKTIPIDDLINIIYSMGDKMYAASFKSLRNNKMESYYEIELQDKKISVALKATKKIVFYK